MNNFSKNDRVIVSSSVTGHTFSARVKSIYTEDSDKSGLILVVDEDDDGFDVEPCDLTLMSED